METRNYVLEALKDKVEAVRHGIQRYEKDLDQANGWQSICTKDIEKLTAILLEAQIEIDALEAEIRRIENGA